MKRKRAPAAKRRRRSTLSHSTAAFINLPYDSKFEPLYLAFIAGICGFGLVPRATLEIPGSQRRLDRILALISACRYSFHDLSRVQLDTKRPPTPRFNMPFELGLAVLWAKRGGRSHEWFVFESIRRRLNKSLSDLDGTDPYIHRSEPIEVLSQLRNALVRSRHQPTIQELRTIYQDVRKAAVRIRDDSPAGTLYESRPFRELVVSAQISAINRIESLRRQRRR